MLELIKNVFQTWGGLNEIEERQIPSENLECHGRYHDRTGARYGNSPQHSLPSLASLLPL